MKIQRLYSKQGVYELYIYIYIICVNNGWNPGFILTYTHLVLNNFVYPFHHDSEEILHQLVTIGGAPPVKCERWFIIPI